MPIPPSRHLPADLAPGSVDLGEEVSLPAAWTQRWSRDTERPVLFAEPSPVSPGPSDDGWVTGGELLERTRRAAGRLYGAGLRKGDRILMSAPTGIDLVVAHIGALRLGCIVVPVNGAYRRDELAHIVADAAPRAAVVQDPEWAAWIAELAPRAVVSRPALELDDDEAPGLDLVEPADPALIGYTSGTTGRPKGAVLTHANLLTGAASLVLAWRWSPDDRLVLALPLFHMHGLGVGLHGTLLAAASAVLVERFDVDTVLDAAARHRATLFFGVPTMYSRLAASPRAAELGRFRLCVSGSAPLSAELHGRIADSSGQLVLERYGMTETVMLVSNPHDGERRPGTVGFPLPGVELRTDGGEVQVRGPNVFPGYWRRPEATAEAFTTDGWFRTGDLGELDDDGYLRLVGRSSELIISGGFNVYPREVEDALADHPHVSEVAVAATADLDWGEVVTAYVVPTTDAKRGEPSLESLRSHVADTLAPFKHPRKVVHVDTLPRNPLGKIQKHLLG